MSVAAIALAARPEHAAAGRVRHRLHLVDGRGDFAHFAGVFDAGVRDRGEGSGACLRFGFVEARELDVDRRAPDAGFVRRRFERRLGGLAAGRHHLHRGDRLVHRAALERQLQAFGGRDEPLLFEIGFFHQPVRESSQQIGMRAAAVVAARPQPCMIGCEQGNAALAFAVEDQKRLIFRAAHHHTAAFLAHLRLTEPPAPRRLLRRIGELRRERARKAARDGMLCAVARDLGLERRLDDAARRRRRQDGRQRRAMDREHIRVVVAGRDQKRAAVLVDVTCDVLVVHELQDSLVLVAVEDDEIEIVDLLRKEFARRKRDKRELIDRRAVLLFRRAKDREVHKVDGGIGFQEIAPGALASVRLAGNKQHAQVLAHAFGRDDDAVVGRRQFALDRLELDLDDVLAGVRKRHVDLHRPADFGAHDFVGLIFAADFARPRDPRVRLCRSAARQSGSAGPAQRCRTSAPRSLRCGGRIRRRRRSAACGEAPRSRAPAPSSARRGPDRR